MSLLRDDRQKELRPGKVCVKLLIAFLCLRHVLLLAAQILCKIHAGQLNAHQLILFLLDNFLNLLGKHLVEREALASLACGLKEYCIQSHQGEFRQMLAHLIAHQLLHGNDVAVLSLGTRHLQSLQLRNANRVAVFKHVLAGFLGIFVRLKQKRLIIIIRLLTFDKRHARIQGIQNVCLG